MTNETEETQSSPWALLFRCIVLFLLHKLCLSTCKGKYMWERVNNTTNETTVITFLGIDLRPTYTFKQSSHQQQEKQRNRIKLLQIHCPYDFLGWENLVQFLCTTASLKLKLQYNIPLHPTAKNPGQRYHLSHYHCKSVNKSIKNQQRYVPNTQSTGLVLHVQ